MKDGRCRGQRPFSYQLEMRNLSFIPLNFEATGERVPFARLKERTEDDDEREIKAIQARAMREEGKSSVMNMLREGEA